MCKNVITEIKPDIPRKTVGKELGKKNQITTRMKITGRSMDKNARAITIRVTKKRSVGRNKDDKNKEKKRLT